MAKAKTKSKSEVSPSERITQYIDEHADWRGKLLAKLRKLFHDVDPAVVEEWKWMGSPVYEHDGIVAITNAHKDKIKVTFAQGASLPDPHKVFNNGLGGNKWRAIDLSEGDKLDEPAFKALVRAAVAHNGTSSGTKKKSAPKRAPARKPARSSR